MVGQTKQKLSVTVSPGLLADLDQAVSRRRYRSRSAAVEAALETWARAERAAEWEAYYDGRSAEEVAESRALADLGHATLSRPDRPARTGRRTAPKRG